MPGQNPHETLNQLIDAINARDVERALTCYHPRSVYSRTWQTGNRNRCNP